MDPKCPCQALVGTWPVNIVLQNEINGVCPSFISLWISGRYSSSVNQRFAGKDRRNKKSKGINACDKPFVR